MSSATIKSRPTSAKFPVKRSEARQTLLSTQKNAVAMSSTRTAEGSFEEMRRKVIDLQSQLDALRAPQLPAVILPELHDQQSGRIDASRVAEFMGVALKPLAEGLGLNYKAVHRSPAAAGFQEALRPVKRSLELLHEFFGPPGAIRIWLNTPHPDLAGATALDTILAGKADAVALILENAWNGVPV